MKYEKNITKDDWIDMSIVVEDYIKTATSNALRNKYKLLLLKIQDKIDE
jgi:hypothetical protein